MHKASWLVLASAVGALLFLVWQLRFLAGAAAGAGTGAVQATGVLIDAVLYDGYAYMDYDEAVRLANVSAAPVDLSGWRLTDGTSTATLPDGIVLDGGETLWLARNAAAFAFQFGFDPDVTLATWPGFANTGDEVVLMLPDGTVVDGLVYGAGDADQGWWHGSAVQPYTVRSLFTAEGQIL
jgi:hypothetical protein